jgi:glycosyltransferase involved in cell wall biosynthesis
MWEQDRMPPLVSVVIPCLGHADTLKRCLQGLEKQTIAPSYEVVVVDSGMDPCVREAAARFPRVRLVRGDTVLLPGEARNLGTFYSRGRYVAFIDADCIPEPCWLRAAASALNGGAVMVGGPVLDAEPLNPIAAADNLMQFADFLPGRPEGKAPHFPGANLAIIRSVMEELGGFPCGLAVGEDTFFSSHVALKWPEGVRFVKGMRVRHHGRIRLSVFWKHQERLGFYRAVLNSRMPPSYRILGRRALFALLIAFKRLGYFVLRVAQWHPSHLPRFTVLLPFLVVGLSAWARGFRRGCFMAQRLEK